MPYIKRYISWAKVEVKCKGKRIKTMINYKLIKKIYQTGKHSNIQVTKEDIDDMKLETKSK